MGRMSEHLGYATVISMLLTLFAASIIPCEAEAIGSPTITIELDDDKKGVSVSPGSTGVIRFQGTVTAEVPLMPPGQYLIVTLQADAGGWPVSIPPSMSFTNNHTEERFEVTVQVPIETSRQTQGQLTISGRWRYSPGTLGGTIDPATAIIEIEQYYSYTVSPRETVTKTGPDSVCEVEFEVHNKGNAADRISLEVTNKDDLEGSGIFASVKTSDLSIPEKQSKFYPVAMVTSPSASPGKYRIEVQVHSIQAESMGDNYTYEETSCFLEVIEGYEDEDDDPIPSDDDEEEDDDTTFDPGSSDSEQERSDGSSSNNVLIYAAVIVGVLFLLIAGLYILRRTTRS